MVEHCNVWDVIHPSTHSDCCFRRPVDNSHFSLERKPVGSVRPSVRPSVRFHFIFMNRLTFEWVMTFPGVKVTVIGQGQVAGWR